MNRAIIQFFCRLLALKSNTHISAILTEIQLRLYNALIKEMHASLCWVPGLSVVAGNEVRGIPAKAAAANVDRQATR